MDEQHPSPNDRAPTHDPAASSMPRIPIPDSADVPEVVRERHDEAGDVALDDSYEQGARDGLQAVARALRAGHGPEILGLVRLLECSPQRVNEILVKLDRLAEGGEQS
jgi:hypothetical protein